MGEGDTGPNTGGMGAYSPAPVVTPDIEQQVMHEIVQRTADALVSEGCPYRGVLFAGLMIKNGKVLSHASDCYCDSYCRHQNVAPTTEEMLHATELCCKPSLDIPVVCHWSLGADAIANAVLTFCLHNADADASTLSTLWFVELALDP